MSLCKSTLTTGAYVIIIENELQRDAFITIKLRISVSRDEGTVADSEKPNGSDYANKMQNGN